MTVSVDEDFVRFGSKSYAVNKITSVDVRERKPHAVGCAVVLVVIAAFLLLAYVTSFMEPGGSLPSMLVFGLIFGALGYWQWQRSRVVEYQLFLITAASEAQAFTTRDESEVLALREQIETAMMRKMPGYGSF